MKICACLPGIPPVWVCWGNKSGAMVSQLLMASGVSRSWLPSARKTGVLRERISFAADSISDGDEVSTRSPPWITVSIWLVLMNERRALRRVGQ